VFGTLPPFVFSPTFLFLLKIIIHIKSTITLFCQINLPEVFLVSIGIVCKYKFLFCTSVYCLVYVSLLLNIQGFVSGELPQIPRNEQKERWEMGVGVCARVLHAANWWKLLIHNSLWDSNLSGTIAGMVTPKGSMSTEGERLQVSVLLYRCSVAPFCFVCLGCCTAKFRGSGGTYELSGISFNAKCTVLVCLVPTPFAVLIELWTATVKSLYLSCNGRGILLETCLSMEKSLNIFHRFPFLNAVKSFASYYMSTV
jgi:hypothetical protein